MTPDLAKGHFIYPFDALCKANPLNPFPNKPWFLHVFSRSLLKTLGEKEKLLMTSNFSLSHSVFYPFGELSAIFIEFEIVVCKLFQFGRAFPFSLKCYFCGQKTNSFAEASSSVSFTNAFNWMCLKCFYVNLKLREKEWFSDLGLSKDRFYQMRDVF